jgi:hypothetical protein
MLAWPRCIDKLPEFNSGWNQSIVVSDVALHAEAHFESIGSALKCVVLEEFLSVCCPACISGFTQRGPQCHDFRGSSKPSL